MSPLVKKSRNATDVAAFHSADDVEGEKN